MTQQRFTIASVMLWEHSLKRILKDQGCKQAPQKNEGVED